MVMDDELTKNESILLEHVGINISQINILNSLSTADQSIFDNLNKEDSLFLTIYVLLMIYYQFVNDSYRIINQEKVLLSNKLKNKNWETREQVCNHLIIINRSLN